MRATTIPGGLWSDGTTIWVADDNDDKIYAYDLATDARRPDLEFSTLIAVGNTVPRGLWSDGITMWVSDHVDDRLYSYNMPSEALLKSLEFTGVDIGAFHTSITGYAARVPSTTTSTTVTAAASAGATVTISPADADGQATGHQVNLSTGDNTVTVTVANGAATRTYTVVITRTAFAVLTGDATLSALALTGIDFGAFSSATTDYAADVAHSVTDTAVAATGTDANAVVTISPADADGLAEGHQVTLAEGANTIAVTVESSDGRNRMTYPRHRLPSIIRGLRLGCSSRLQGTGRRQRRRSCGLV